MRRAICQIALAFVFIALSFTFSYAQKLSADEQKIIDYVDAHMGEALGMLESVVDIESPSEDIAGVKQVGMVFKRELESLGLTARWIEMPAEMKRAGHLVASTKGTKGRRILLLGHIDTVLRGEKFRREGKKAFGTGSADMKAGDVVLLFALKALNATGALKDTRITVMLTGDEESVGRPIEISRRDMVAAAKDSDLALSFEATVGNSATVGRRGSSNWKLEVDARTGHSAGIFSEGMGSGAIFEAARIVNQFYEALHQEKYLTFNPSIIVGGTEATLDGPAGTAKGKTNVVAAKAIVMGDLRFISEEQKEAARVKMREIVARALPRASSKITFDDGYPAMTPSEGNYALLKEMDQVSQDLGFGKIEALDPGARGAGDIAFVSHLIPGLDGIGASGGGAHAPGESVDLESLPKVTKKAAVLIYRLTR
ncbi:MAG: M20/M25/M40 family metallo-hydrolase [Acidobacteriota bacterium]|nr:M20/M25/M40 family metallo-hydrolase [Acidobacteriota bacterium]